MSFRERLLLLLAEHEQLEKKHEHLLEVMQKSSKSSDDCMLADQSSTRDHKASDEGETLSDNQPPSVLGERDTALDILRKVDALPKDQEISTGEHIKMLFDTQSHPSFDSESKIESNPSRRFTRSDILSSLRRKKRLKRIFEVTESFEAEEEEKKQIEETNQKMGMWYRIEHLNRQQLEAFIDIWVNLAIVGNALFIGLQMDLDADDGFGPWQLADTLISCVFVIEVCLKCWVHGLREHMCGKDRVSNLFDVFLIFIDLFQLVLSYFELKRRFTEAGVPSASLFRVIRLIRITRLIRLLRTEKFRDLVAMVQGMITGSTTLFWALVMFFVISYVGALVCRSAFGYHGVESIEPYFETVPVAMYTVYRCSFGDCTSEYGTPIPEHVLEEYGGVYALIYTGMSFIITIGLFNVISAIFVDSTMTSAAAETFAKENARMNDERRWALNVTVIIREVSAAMGAGEALLLSKLSEVIEEVAQMEFTRELLDDVVLKKPSVIHALDALDIDRYDHKRLSDILDPDHSGTVTVLDLMNGLQRLRGHPRRSDVVTVDLMVRALQERVDVLHDKIEALLSNRT